MQQYVAIVQNDANSANHSAQRSWRRARARDAGGGERRRAAQLVAIDCAQRSRRLATAYQIRDSAHGARETVERQRKAPKTVFGTVQRDMVLGTGGR
eukprot:5870871-Pleurochrysis_carterae.AAC.2